MTRRSLVGSFIDGLRDRTQGDGYRTILGYFWPELIVAFLVSAALTWTDGWFISHLKSTDLYAAQGATALFVQFLNKIAEGFTVGILVTAGFYNGRQELERVGDIARAGLFVTITAGIVCGIVLWGMPTSVCTFLCLPPELAVPAATILRVRSLTIVLAFCYAALIGLLRSVKRVVHTMRIFIAGACVFVVADYILVFGVGGVPACGVYGAAWASVLQYAVMVGAAAWYIRTPEVRLLYDLSWLRMPAWNDISYIVSLSWPVMVDKAALAFAKLWLVRMIAPLGSAALASYTVIKDIEQLAFVPAIALANVVTVLVSNRHGSHDWRGIKSTVKKTLTLAIGMVTFLLVLFSWRAHDVVALFDHTGTFLPFACRALPWISALVITDIVQVILAGALRGVSEVRAVMLTRLAVLLGVFLPCSWILALWYTGSTMRQFVAVYATFYISNACMSIVYVYLFRQRGSATKAEVLPARRDDEVIVPRVPRYREHNP